MRSASLIEFVLQKGSSNDLTGYANLGLAGATVLVAIIAIYQAGLTRRAVQAAQNGALEEMKSRVDQRAPSVVISTVKPARLHKIG